MVKLQQDYKELFELFNANKVEYMIVGAYALAYHGAPRYTGDIDILVRPEEKNAQCVVKALNEFGFESLDLQIDDFAQPDKVVQLGVAPVRIDIITSISGVSWEEAAAGQVQGTYGDIPVYYIGKEQFIKNKRAIGRNKDLADIDTLTKE